MLHQISIYSVFLPLILGVINLKNLEANARLLLLIVSFASIPHIATIIDKELPVGFYNSYIIVDVVLWPVIFFKSLKGTITRRIVVFLLGLNFVIATGSILYLGILKRFYYEVVALTSIFQVLLITIYFYELNFMNRYVSLQNQRMFWFCIGLLFYAPCTFFIFLFYSKINHYYSKSGLNYLWEIHNFFNAIMYLLFAYGLILEKRKLEPL